MSSRLTLGLTARQVKACATALPNWYGDHAPYELISQAVYLILRVFRVDRLQVFSFRYAHPTELAPPDIVAGLREACRRNTSRTGGPASTSRALSIRLVIYLPVLALDALGPRGDAVREAALRRFPEPSEALAARPRHRPQIACRDRSRASTGTFADLCVG